MDKRGFLRVMVAATLATVMLSGCSSVKNLFGGRNKDKTGEPAKLVDFTASAKVNKLWSVSVGKGEDRLGIGQQPAVLDGNVYAAAVDGGVSAYTLSSGAQLWHHESKEARLSGGPGAGDGLVVVGGLEGEVVALNAADGQEKWTAKVGNEVLSAPAIGGGMVFVHSNDGRVTAFDAGTGARRWFHSVESPALTVRGTGGITLGPGIVFVGGDNGTLTALNMNDGNVLWSTPVAQADGRTELERMADVDAAPVLEGTTLFASSYKGRTVAIDGPSGQVMWTSDHGGARGAAISNSAVIVTDKGGMVVGLDKNSGGSLWQQSELANRNVSAPAVQGDYAVVGDLDGVLHWLRLNDGAFAARSKMGDAIVGRPVVADGVLVVQSRDGKLAAFALQ
ncbi:outer membrane protein assembly factor BamB [Thermomonas fusca]|uniref:Outer membrane protein assembly factor BamB n=1 Tax=Thermomonas fusca TaxID=215690 RepID=A0A5R9PFV2_9GAMM|nr:outer membrane protein assembly factor BamB [Thermomonas fusca]TLX22345.1 outer membrane protein assembly factor BamB [Thermomonas fusca]